MSHFIQKVLQLWLRAWQDVKVSTAKVSFECGVRGTVADQTLIQALIESVQVPREPIFPSSD